MAFTGLDPETQERLFGAPDPDEIDQLDTNDANGDQGNDSEKEPVQKQEEPPAKKPDPAPAPAPAPTRTDMQMSPAEILAAGEAKEQMRQELRKTYGNALTNDEIDKAMSTITETLGDNIAGYKQVLSNGGHMKFADSIVGEKLRKGQLKKEGLRKETTSVGAHRRTENDSPSAIKKALKGFGGDPALEKFFNEARTQ